MLTVIYICKIHSTQMNYQFYRKIRARWPYLIILYNDSSQSRFTYWKQKLYLCNFLVNHYPEPPNISLRMLVTAILWSSSMWKELSDFTCPIFMHIVNRRTSCLALCPSNFWKLFHYNFSIAINPNLET